MGFPRESSNLSGDEWLSPFAQLPAQNLAITPAFPFFLVFLTPPFYFFKKMSIYSASFCCKLSLLYNTTTTNPVTQSSPKILCCCNHLHSTNPLHLVSSTNKSARPFTLNCLNADYLASTLSDSPNLTHDHEETGSSPSPSRLDSGCGGGGGDHGGGNGGGEGEGDEADSEEEKEFGPIMRFDEVIKETEARGVQLPADILEAAKTTGIRKMFLLRYLDLQGSAWPLSFLMKYCTMLRNRMLADPSFLFKAGTEIVIDSSCATFAEVQKRGKEFWSEFELYAADLLVGIVVDVALVGMLAPYARFGQASVSRGIFGKLQQACAALPSSVFEVERPGCRFSVKQRIATYFYKGVLYGSVGFGCGLIGQGIANLIMTAKRSIKKSEEDIPVPPLLQSAALWGVFLAVSSNTRYQIINGLESLVEGSPFAKRVPPVAMAFTVGVRFANNIYGGMQFVDWAKWSGVQ